MNKKKLKEIATSLTTLIFLVIAISGVMLYFHLFSSSVKQLHEILGLGFVIAATLHVYVNWNSMKSYFSKSTFLISTLLIVVISSVFIVANSVDKVHPKTLIIQSVLNASIEESLKILNIDYMKAQEILSKQNIDIENYQSINELANKNGIKPLEIIIILKK